MECPNCGNQLRIGTTFMTFDGANTPESPIKAFTNLSMICVHHECVNYGGQDLEKPKRIVETLKTPIN